MQCSHIIRQGLHFIAAIAIEEEQNAVDHCGNDGNFLPHSVIFIDKTRQDNLLLRNNHTITLFLYTMFYIIPFLSINVTYLFN